MRIIITSVLLLFSILSSLAQGEFTITGKLTGVKDGVVLKLIRMEGIVGATIATDTIKNGSFSFRQNTSGNEVERYSLDAMSSDYPSSSLHLYITPDSKINITGNDYLIDLWNVESNIKDQKEDTKFHKVSYDLWKEYLMKRIEINKCYDVFRDTISTNEAKEEAKKKIKTLQKETALIYMKIMGNNIAVMHKSEISKPWLENLMQLSMAVRYTNDFPYKQQALDLYNNLSDAQKQLVSEDIKANLFPPVTVKIGDMMADGDLYDLDGNMHHLSDFKGKYILLDFWSCGCGPCMMSFPEMKEVHELYKNKLTIVSLSSDGEKFWKEYSKDHDMIWMNLNDLKNTGGLYAKYGVNGIPNYVFISPEGKVLRTWTGYSPGLLKFKIKRLLESSAPKKTSVEMNNGIKIISNPKFESVNNETLEILSVKLSDTATILNMKAYYIPKNWIRLASASVKLVGSDGKEYGFLSSDGFKMDSNVFLPESGEMEFTLVFMPMPSGVKSFDFKEGKEKNNWNIIGVKLE